MKKLLYILSFVISLTSSAQVFWTENFGTGCSQGTLASGFVSANGAWAVTNTGSNGMYANTWYISATEAGMGVGACGDGCGTSPGLTNRTLHVGATFVSVDGGASYFAGPLLSNSDRRVESPAISCSGYTSIILNFLYMENGDGTLDDATLWYYNGTTWAQLSNPAKTALTCSPQGVWTNYSIALPASANNNSNIKIGFHWVDNDDGVGTDPSFAVDDITLSGTAAPSCSVQISQTQAILCNGDCNGALLATATGTGTITYQWNIGPPVPFGNISNLCAGTYTVTITDNAACSATASFTLTQPTPLIIGPSLGAGVLCYGDCTGTITTNVSGGTPPYNYQWSDGNIIPTLTNLCAGIYTVTVTDANGCTVSASYIVTEPPLLILGNLITSNPSCVGCTDGTICLGGSNGGTPPYSFSITPNATFNGNCFQNLGAGIYTVCITDANGCTVCQTDTVRNPPSGFGENFTSGDIIIYPNPFSEMATIEMYSGQCSIYTLVIYDAMGKEVKKSQILNPKSQISRGDLQSGIYFMDLIGVKNNIVWRGKFMIK